MNDPGLPTVAAPLITRMPPCVEYVSADARTSDRDGIDLDGRTSDADRHALPVLSARPDPVAHLDVFTEHRHAAQDFRTIADQVYALERRGDLAIFDEITLGQREDEVAIGDVHLAAAEFARIDPTLHASEDLVGVVRAGQEDRVGHPGHRRAREALAPTVSARFQVKVARAQAVVHVADELALLDEGAAPRLVALVVHVDGAATLQERRVVHDRAQFAGDVVTDLARIVARPFSVEIGLQPVAHGLVKQDAAVARRQYDLHLTCGRVVRGEHRDRLPSGFASMPHRALALEVTHPGASAPAARTL